MLFSWNDLPLLLPEFDCLKLNVWLAFSQPANVNSGGSWAFGWGSPLAPCRAEVMHLIFLPGEGLRSALWGGYPPSLPFMGISDALPFLVCVTY